MVEGPRVLETQREQWPCHFLLLQAMPGSDSEVDNERDTVIFSGYCA